jgi:hypothetical protein
VAEAYERSQLRGSDVLREIGFDVAKQSIAAPRGKRMVGAIRLHSDRAVPDQDSNPLYMTAQIQPITLQRKSDGPEELDGNEVE